MFGIIVAVLYDHLEFLWEKKTFYGFYRKARMVRRIKTKWETFLSWFRARLNERTYALCRECGARGSGRSVRRAASRTRLVQLAVRRAETEPARGVRRIGCYSFLLTWPIGKSGTLCRNSWICLRTFAAKAYVPVWMSSSLIHARAIRTEGSRKCFPKTKCL